MQELWPKSPFLRLLTLGCLIFIVPIAMVYVHKEAAHVRNWQILFSLGLLAMLTSPVHRAALWKARVPAAVWRLLAGCLLVALNASVWTKYWAFQVNAYDFSLFEWSLHNTLQGRFMENPVCNCDHFGIHYTPILLLLLPLQWLFSSKLLLLSVHATAIWACLFPLRRLLTLRQIPEGVGFFMVLAFFGSHFTGSTLGYPFHPEAFYPLAMLWFLVGLETRQWPLALAALLAGLLIKEDAGIYFAALAGVLALFPRQQAGRLLPGVCVLVASGAFAIVYGVLLPQHQEGGPAAAFSLWQSYGPTPMAAAKAMLLEPNRIAVDLMTSHWLAMYLWAALLPLLDWRAVLAMLPGALILATADHPVMKQFGLYYSAPLLAVYFWGWIHAGQKLGSGRGRWWLVASLIIAPLIGKGYIKFYPPKWPLKAELADLVATLPSDRTVCVQSSLMPHLPMDLPVALLNAACLQDPNAIALYHPELDAFPLSHAELATLTQDGTRQQSRLGLVRYEP